MKAIEKYPYSIVRGAKMPEMIKRNLLPIVDKEVNCGWIASIINASVEMFYVQLGAYLFELIAGHERVLKNKDCE